MFWLYRATAPSVRAQSIQVVHTAHASAARGHHVTLCVQADRAGRSAHEILAFYGLQPVPGLHLRVLPAGNTGASMAFRAAFAQWAVRGGVAIARSKRYAAEALDRLGGRFELVLEAHEVDSLQAIERGEDPAGVRALEAKVLARARGVVCNCEGTEALLREAHPGAPPSVALHNATHPSRVREPAGPGEGIGYAGSLRAVKQPEVLADAARLLSRPLVVVGPDRDEALLERSGGWLRFEGPLPHHALPDRLARFQVLALSVGRGLFGERLTSPLKLWDYLAVGRPVVAADTPAIRVAAGDAFEPFAVGDASELAAAIDRIAADPERAERRIVAARGRARTWTQRAEELDAFLDGVLS